MSDETPRDRFFSGIERDGGLPALTANTPRERFFEGFALDSRGLASDIDAACPTPPASTKVAAESRSNYSALANGDNAENYGLTALMAVQAFSSSCYGSVTPGYVLLFPGSYESNPPPFAGQVSLNCAQRSPLTPAAAPLHAQMCSALNLPTLTFIGFALWYPYTDPDNVRFNSGTCNPPYFGNNAVSSNCDGTNWQSIITSTLKAWLPS